MCHEVKEILIEVVRELDLMGGGDLKNPGYYRGIHGQEYRLSNFLLTMASREGPGGFCPVS
jgi:hypothetical protein